MNVYLSSDLSDRKKMRDMDTKELIQDLEKTYDTWYMGYCEISPMIMWWAKNRMLAIMRRIGESEPLWNIKVSGDIT